MMAFSGLTMHTSEVLFLLPTAVAYNVNTQEALPVLCT